MLQKLLIAFCAVALTACGGSLDLGPEYPPPVIEQPEPEEPGGSCETIAGQTFTYTFASSSEADEWFVNGGESSINVQLDYDEAESALLIVPILWDSEESNWRRQARTELGEAINLTDAQITVEFYLPEAYVNDGGMSLQLILQGDGTWADSYRGSGGFDAGDNTWIWEVGTAETAEYFGIQLSTLPNDLTILDEIIIRSVTIEQVDVEICTEAPELVELSLSVTDGWKSVANYQDDDGEEPDFTYVSEGVMVHITDVNQQLVYEIDGPIDLRRAESVFTISADTDYIGNASAVQPFQQVFIRGETEDDDDEQGGNWGCWTGSTGWTAGEPVEITCDLPNNDLWNVEEGQFIYFGAQSQGENAQGSFTIHSVLIRYYSSGAPEPDVTSPGTERDLAADETGTWSVEDDGASVQYTTDGVAFSPDFSGEHNPKLVYLLEGPVDMEGLEFTVEFMVEQEFLDANAILRAHAQQSFGSYTQHQCRANNDELTAGEPFSLTCSELPAAIAAEDGQRLRIGIEVDGDGDLGNITITKLTVTAR